MVSTLMSRHGWLPSMLLIIASLSSLRAALADPVTHTKDMLVKAEIEAGCVIAADPNQITGIDFGTLDFGVHPSIQSGELGAAVTAGLAATTIQCTPGLALSIMLGAGDHAAASQRQLANAGNTSFVPYAMYSDASHGAAIAIGVATPVALDASGGMSFLPLFGVATTNGTHAVGAYSDVIAVTLSW
jgi:spore coat protein U-like protein